MHRYIADIKEVEQIKAKATTRVETEPGKHGALYPVSMRYCLKEVLIESELGKKIRVYDMKGQEIAEHRIRLFNKGIRPVHPEHEEINESYRKKKETYRTETVKKFIETFVKEGSLYVEGLKRAVGANLYWHIDEIMKYTDIYSIEDVRAVLSECIEIGAYHKDSVKRLLQGREVQKQTFDCLNQPLIVSSVDIRRPLSES